jgi:hypothetical protein
VRQTVEVARQWIHAYDERLREWELSIVTPAQPHDVHTFDRRRSIPGVGKSLALVRLDAIHASNRFPRVQACVS